MAPNKKLTSVIRERTIQDFRSDLSGLSVRFSDGSVLLVKGKGTTDQQLKGGSKIASVFEQGDDFVIACEDHSRLSLERCQRAAYPNHVWSWDIIYNQLENGPFCVRCPTSCL